MISGHWNAGSLSRWSGDAEHDARELLNWAAAKGVNPADSRFTTLGSILQQVLQDVGLDDFGTIVALIVVYKHYRDRKLLDNLMMRYQVPLAAGVALEGVREMGPDIEW